MEPREAILNELVQTSMWAEFLKVVNSRLEALASQAMTPTPLPIEQGSLLARELLAARHDELTRMIRSVEQTAREYRRQG